LFRGKCPDEYQGLKGISFLGEVISDQAYWENLRLADIVVVPYPPPCFTFRTSGILVDALVSETPSIVLGKTWLSGVVDRLGVGMSINYKGPVSIVSAIKVMSSNSALVAERLKRGKKLYLEQNT